MKRLIIIKLFACVTAIVLCLGLLTACGEKALVTSKYISNARLEEGFIELESNPQSMTACKNIAFVLSGNVVSRYDLVTKEPVEIIKDFDIKAIACDEYRLAAYCDGIIKLYDYDGALLDEVKITEEIENPNKIFLSGSEAIIATLDAPINRLYYVNLKTKKTVLLPNTWTDGSRDGMVKSISINDGKLDINFIYNCKSMNYSCKYVRYDIESDSIEDSRDLHSNGYYCKNDDLVYYSYSHEFSGMPYFEIKAVTANEAERRVYVFDKAKLEFSDIYDIPTAEVIYTDGTDFILHEQNKRNRIIFASVSEIKPLVIYTPVGADMSLYSMATVYANKMGKPVIFETIPADEYSDRLRTKLLAGDDDFDLFWVDEPNLLRSILANTAYEPLNGYDSIMSDFNNMYDGVKSLMTDDESVFGIPYSIAIMWGNTFNVDYDIPEFWNYEDMYRVCDELIGTDKALFIEKECILSIINHFIQDSITMDGDVDEKELAELLDNIKKYYDLGVFSKDGDESKTNILGYGINYFTPFVYLESIESYESGIKAISYPTRSGYSYLPVNVTLMMNRNSAAKNEAAELLAEIASEENIYNQKVFENCILGKDVTKNSNYNEWSEGDIELIKFAGDIYANSKLLTVGTRAQSAFLLFDDNAPLADMFDGIITPEEAAKRICDYVNYTYFE